MQHPKCDNFKFVDRDTARMVFFTWLGSTPMRGVLNPPLNVSGIRLLGVQPRK